MHNALGAFDAVGKYQATSDYGNPGNDNQVPALKFYGSQCESGSYTWPFRGPYIDTVASVKRLNQSSESSTRSEAIKLERVVMKQLLMQVSRSVLDDQLERIDPLLKGGS